MGVGPTGSCWRPEKNCALGVEPIALCSHLPESAAIAAVLVGHVVPRDPLAAVRDWQPASREIRAPFDKVPRARSGGVGLGTFEIDKDHH